VNLNSASQCEVNGGMSMKLVQGDYVEFKELVLWLLRQSGTAGKHNILQYNRVVIHVPFKATTQQLILLLSTETSYTKFLVHCTYILYVDYKCYVPK
jgi:hypothetical protein